MILTRRVALGGIQLDSIDSAVVIRSVDTGTPHENIRTVNRMGGAGQRMTGQHWETLEVSVKYAIDLPKRQIAERRAVFDAVNAWALAGGWLTTSERPGKRMRAEKVVLPADGDLWNWTEEYTLTFRAYGVPFWQDSTATEASGDRILVPGQVRTVCNADITNDGSSTIDTLSIRVGSSTMEFDDLGLEAGETLKIGHTADGLLTLRIWEGSTNRRSAMSKRTGGSADDLWVDPGGRSIVVSDGEAEVTCYGRYT